MSTTKATSGLSKFVAATIAFITGDTDTAIALKNERLGKAAIKGQISALEGSLVSAEMNLENKKESLEKAIYPTVLIKDQQSYYNAIVIAQRELQDAEEELEMVKSSIEFANTLLLERF